MLNTQTEIIQLHYVLTWSYYGLIISNKHASIYTPLLCIIKTLCVGYDQSHFTDEKTKAALKKKSYLPKFSRQLALNTER